MSDAVVRLRLPNVVAFIRDTPWAILESKLQEIVGVVSAHAAGATLPPQQDPYAARRDAMRQRATGATAVVPVYGAIVPRAGLMTDYSGATSAESIAQQVTRAANDPNVGTIVLDMDSPGGSVFGIAEAAEAIYAARGKKRVVAMVNTMAASAAYWLASQADEIVASPSSMSGNIGVIMTHLVTEAADEAEGFEWQVVSAGKYKHEGHAGKRLDEDALAAMQALADDYYTQFVNAVARGRGVKPAAVRAGYGEGRILTASQAMAAGVVDRIATLDELLTEMGADASAPRTPLRADTAPITPAAGGVEATPAASHLSLVTAAEARSNIVEQNAAPVAAGATTADLMAAERKRVSEITALASEHHIDATKVQAWVNGGASIEAVSLEILRAKKAEAATQTPTPAATSVVVGPERETQKPFANFGEFIGAVRTAEVNSYAMDPRLKPLAAAIGMGVGLGADGGFLVPEQFADGVVKIAFEGGEILSRVNEIPVSGNQYHLSLVDEVSRVNGSRWGGVRGFWIGEGDTVTASRPKFRRHTLDVTKKYAVLTYISAEQLEDAPASARVLEQAFAEEMTFGIEQSIWEGSGAGQPLGFMNSGALVTQAAEASQTAATINAANLTKMYSRLLRSARRNAVWFINQDAEPQLPLITVGQQPVYLPPGGLSGQPYGTLFGRPVIPVEFASTLGAVGDIVLASLDWYALGTKARGQLARSMHVRFLQDEEAFRMTFRCDGSPMLTQPITPFKGSNTQSAFVALAARA